MTGSVVDMAPFYWLVAVPAAAAVLAAAACVLAAWRRPALRTPVASLKVWRFVRRYGGRCSECRTPYVQADGGCRSCCDSVWPDHMGSI